MGDRPAGSGGVVEPHELHPDPPETGQRDPLGEEQPPPLPGDRRPPGPIRKPDLPRRGKQDAGPTRGDQERLGGDIDGLDQAGVVEPEQRHPDLVGPGQRRRRVAHEAEEQRLAALAAGDAVEGLELRAPYRRQLGLDLGDGLPAADVDAPVGAGAGAACVLEAEMAHPLRGDLLGVVRRADGAGTCARNVCPPVVRHLVRVPRPLLNFGDTPSAG